VCEKQNGFTLVEVLIVMLIISIVGAASLLTISHNKNTKLENFSVQLVNLINLAEQQAMLQPAVLGLAFTADTLQFYQYQEKATAGASHWVALTDSVLGSRRIPKNTQISLKIQGKPAADTKEPQILLSTSGDLPAFVILIGEKDAPPRYQVVGREDGSVTKGEPPHEN
jgi:type II secretion system protein H